MNIQPQAIPELLHQIAALNLETPKSFGRLTPAKLVQIYNGTGPDWMPAWGATGAGCLFKSVSACCADS
ncbi:MAG: hypothetical protein GY750_14070 [Lentisphaerae bacterium]|nr:hypothetical protein [Lentisphaerota bacterium]MCP4102526.1 hypothetical protein [Lentisphaerota bacterium]